MVYPVAFEPVTLKERVRVALSALTVVEMQETEHPDAVVVTVNGTVFEPVEIERVSDYVRMKLDPESVPEEASGVVAYKRGQIEASTAALIEVGELDPDYADHHIETMWDYTWFSVEIPREHVAMVVRPDG